jgi:formate hydrogenlyase subunit 6/NADH:ubiquinone oxidoreductase subunit I
MEKRNIYQGLIEWFRKSGAYVPKSGTLEPLIEETYTVEEADCLTGMPLSLTEIDELAKIKGKDPVKLRAKLNEMAGRGLIYRTRIGGKIKYRPNPPRFVYLRSFFWPGRNDEHTKSVAPHVTRYYLDGFGDHWKDVKTKGLRALPIGKTIEDPRGILPYEAVLEVLQGQDRFAVATCACRHRKNSDPNLPNCTHTTENCLHFGKFADYIIENGLGREIGLDESLEILGNAAEEGLVHAVSNWKENVDTICNCCKCCCVYFQAFHVLKHDSSMSPSNYQVHVQPESCLGCGLCVKRCPMDALQLVESPLANNKTGKVSEVQEELCIGCGVCAYKCPSESLVLRRRESCVDPPANVVQLKRQYAEEKAKRLRKEGRKPVPENAYMGDVSSGEAIE